MKLENKIREILPNATIKSIGLKAKIETTETLTARVGEVNATELKQLLKFGLTKIKRSGSGLTLKF